MTTTINAVASTGLVQTSDGSGVIKAQSNGVTTNAGTFTIAFTSALADANYVPTVCGSSNGTNSTVPWAYINSNVTQTTGQFGCYFQNMGAGGATYTYTDPVAGYVAIFGN